MLNSNEIGVLAKWWGHPIDVLQMYGINLKAIDESIFGFARSNISTKTSSGIQSGSIALISNIWVGVMEKEGVDVENHILPLLCERFSTIIGLDQGESFKLSFSNNLLRQLDRVIKINGIYQDKDLYNYVVGATTPLGHWTEKNIVSDARYDLSQLGKLHFSIPFFFRQTPDFRAKFGVFNGDTRFRRFGRQAKDLFFDYLPKPLKKHYPPPQTVHFYAAYTHVQRADAVRRLRNSSLHWQGGITSVAETIAGLDGVGYSRPALAERNHLMKRLESEGLTTQPLGRFAYNHSMRNCKAVLSITGHGELCYRMAEAWTNRRILVCQNLSHAEIRYPLRAGRNVIYCEPDLSDLVDILDDIECNFGSYIDIAEQGYCDWREWSQQTGRVFHESFSPLFN